MVAQATYATSKVYNFEESNPPHPTFSQISPPQKPLILQDVPPRTIMIYCFTIIICNLRTITIKEMLVEPLPF